MSGNSPARLNTSRDGGERVPGAGRNLFEAPVGIHSIKGEVTMAKPSEPGLTLEGEDARRFHEYMERPTYTDDARELIRSAAREAQNRRL